MSEQAIMTDDSSHYEISLTAGQAFTAFVLLLFSLAASFAFGLMVGKGQSDERLVVKHEVPVINESSAAAASPSAIVELGVPKSARTAAPVVTEEHASDPTIVEDQPAAEPVADPAKAVTADASVHGPAVEASPAAASTVPAAVTPAVRPAAVEHRPAAVAAVTPHTEVKVAAAAPAATPKVPVFAQLLSTGDAHAAESLAARLIDSGFTSAYVERLPNAGGMTYRVRVRFSSEEEARAASDRLRGIAKSDPWIIKQ